MNMKKRLVACLVIFALLCSSLLPAAAAEETDLLVNGGFETGDSTGWNWFNNAVVDSAAPHSGNYCAKVAKNSSYEQVVTVSPDTKYVLTGWAKSEGSSVMTLGVKNYGGQETFSATLSADYQQLTVTFTTGPNAQTATIYGYRQNSGSGAGYFDDVELTAVQDFAPYQPLANAIAPQAIPTYDGTNQLTHPSVVKFEQPWNGYLYWMAMTPYPFNDGSYENPSIVASNDGENWIVPEGVSNPLAGTPSPGHNCDVDLVYVPASDELRMYYVEADDIISSRVKMMSSRDGVHWSEPQVVMQDLVRKYSILSPSIEILPDGTYMMWYVDTGNAGWNSQNNQVKYRTSADGIKWSGAVTCTDFVQPGYQIWHIDVHYDTSSGAYYAVYPAYPNGTDCDHCNLFFAVNRTGKQWETFSRPILKPSTKGGWDDFCIYRSSMLIDDGMLKVWYGAKKQEDSSWHTGLTMRDFSEFMKILER